MPLINCEVSLIVTSSNKCVITTMATIISITTTWRDTFPTGETFEIKDTKLYVPVITLSTEHDNKLLK